MTYKPPGPFDSLIKDLLGNVQRNADATMRRLETADERNFQREQMETQRGFQLDDRQWHRDNQLTDEAVTIRLAQRDELLSVLPYMSNDDPNYDAVMEMIRQLGEPLTLQGEEARRAAMNQNIVLADGSTTSLASLIARLARQRDVTMRTDGWQDTIFNNALDFVADTSRDPEVRAARVNSVKGLSFMNDDLLESLLLAAGVNDPDDRQAVKDGANLRAQQIALGQQAIALGSIQLGQQAIVLNEMASMQGLEKREREAALRALQQDYDLTGMEAFMSLGLLPDSPEERARLARLVPAANGDPERLAELAEVNFRRSVRTAEATTQSLEAANELTGVQITREKLETAIARYAHQRDQLWDDIHDRREMGAWALAASTLGDVETLEMLQSLQGTPGYEALDSIQFTSLIERASAIRGDEADLREYNRVLRDLDLSNETIANVENVDTYITGLAEKLLLEDFSIDEATGERAGLNSAIDGILRRLSQAQLDRLGVTADELRQRLFDEAIRLRLNEDRSQDVTYLAALEQSIPPPTDAAAQAAWRANYAAVAERLGLDVGVMESIADGLLSGADMDFWLSASEAQQRYQQAALLYEQTVAQFLENQATFDALAAGEPMTLDLEFYGDILDMVRIANQAANDAVNNSYCSGIASDEQMFTNDGRAFDGSKADCVAAAERVDSTQRLMDVLLSAVIGGGKAVIGGTGEAGAPMGPPPVPFNVISAGLRERGVAPEEVDAERYELLSPEAQNDLARMVAEGHLTSAEDIGLFMAEAEFQDALDMGLVVPPSGQPSLESVGIDPRSEEWLAKSATQKASELAGTQEWFNLAAELASSGVPLGQMSADDLGRAAQEFGFMVPITSQAGKAAQVRAAGGQPSAPPNPYADYLAGRDPIGAIPMSPDGQPDFSQGLKGVFQRIGHGAGEAVRSTVDAVTSAAGQVWDGARFVWDPALVQGGGQSQASERLVPDLEGFTAAIEPVVESLRADALEALRATDRTYRAMSAAANPPATEEVSDERPRGRYGIPGPRDHTGAGVDSSYDAPRDGTPRDDTPLEGLRISVTGAQELKDREGLKLEAYEDVGGYSIGYGHHGVAPDLVITKEQAEQLFRLDVQEIENAIARDLPGVKLSQQQHDALVSFMYNLGPNILRGAENAALRNALREGRWEDAANIMRQYHNVTNPDTGEKEPHDGLIARRNQEADLFLAGAR